MATLFYSSSAQMFDERGEGLILRGARTGVEAGLRVLS
jgi:hypothetical protein